MSKSIKVGALLLATGKYAPTVFVNAWGENYHAYVCDHSTDLHKAIAIAKKSIATQGYLNDVWRAYTNSAGVLDWFESQDFIVKESA